MIVIIVILIGTSSKITNIIIVITITSTITFVVTITTNSTTFVNIHSTFTIRVLELFFLCGIIF